MTQNVLPQYKNCHAMYFIFGHILLPVQLAGFCMPAGAKKEFVCQNPVDKTKNILVIQYSMPSTKNVPLFPLSQPFFGE